MVVEPCSCRRMRQAVPSTRTWVRLEEYDGPAEVTRDRQSGSGLGEDGPGGNEPADGLEGSTGLVLGHQPQGVGLVVLQPIGVEEPVVGLERRVDRSRRDARRYRERIGQPG